MKLITKNTLILGLTFAMSIVSYAHTCNADEQDKAEYFAEQAGEKIVDKFGGGRDIITELVMCHYNSYAERFRINLEVHWNGVIFRSNHYEIDGVLSVSMDGTQTKFSRTYANEKVKDLEFFEAFATGIIVLGELSNQK